MGTPITPLRFSAHDEHTSVHAFSVNVSASFGNVEVILVSEYFKLVGVVLVEECDGDSHDAVATSWAFLFTNSC